MKRRRHTLEASIFFTSPEKYLHTMQEIADKPAGDLFDLAYGMRYANSYVCEIRLGKDISGSSPSLDRFRKWAGSLSSRVNFRSIEGYEFQVYDIERAYFSRFQTTTTSASTSSRL